MGEIADGMINGTLCATCGAYIEEDKPSYYADGSRRKSFVYCVPRYCSIECVPVIKSKEKNS